MIYTCFHKVILTVNIIFFFRKKNYIYIYIYIMKLL